MLYYAAPMEGITTYIYRRAHARLYGGIDKYFTPFIADRKMTVRERRDILPENNAGVPLVPQILTNKAADFLCIAERIASYGYDTVNLNLGCPSGTVAAKKRGAGFLSNPDALDAFLYEIYARCPLKISIKTRLGVADLKEWERLLTIYTKYPVEELIVHTRLLQEFYTGRTHPQAYAQAVTALEDTEIPLCYNGDVTSVESRPDTAYGTSRVMIGRGLLRNPALANELRSAQGSPFAGRKDVSLSGADRYRQIMSGDLPVLFKMKDLWTYMICCFTDTDTRDTDAVLKHLKKIRKADRLSEYTIAIDHLFREYQSP